MKPEFANFNPHLPGRWVNESQGWGYVLNDGIPHRGFFGREKMVYPFELVEDHPLTYVQEDGTRIRPCRYFQTDQASIPPFAQGFLPKDRSPAYYLHDDQYRSGGAWMALPGRSSFVFCQIRRDQADALLRATLQAGRYPVSRRKALAIWSGVRLGAAFDYLVFWKRPLWHAWKEGMPGTDRLFDDPERPDVDDPLPMGAN